MGDQINGTKAIIKDINEGFLELEEKLSYKKKKEPTNKTLP